MKSGRKPDLDANQGRGDVIRPIFPGAGAAEPITEPTAEHIATAKTLRPRGMPPKERAVWDNLAPTLVMLGRLDAHYVHAFAEYCKVYIRKAHFESILDDEGDGTWTYETHGRNGNQLKAHPLAAQVNECFRQWRSLVGEFGLTPASARNINSPQLGLFGAGELSSL